MHGEALEAVVAALEPEDDGFVAFCDIYVDGDGPYRVQNSVRVIDTLLRRIKTEKRTLTVPEYGLVITPEHDCRTEAVRFDDAERAAYYDAKRRYWSGPREAPYPEPPARLTTEHEAILAARGVA